MAKTSMERIREWGEIIAALEENAREIRPYIERMPWWLKPLDLPALSARLREALGPNFQLGYDLIVALTDDDPLTWMKIHGDPTVKIDAAVALVRSVLPGCQISIWLDTQGARVSIWEADGDLAAYRESASTLPLALCLALVEWKVKHDGA